ncbi:YecA family protein [Coprococcus catus]
MLFSWKIKDNEPCPCGSNKAYKDCCEGVCAAPPSSSRKPPEVQIMEKMRSSMVKCCLHPDHANCKGRIKEAHALQNNKIISLLAGQERHVYMLDAKKKPILLPLENGEVIPYVEVSRISANDATTETCFCDLHDNIAFAAIEKGAPDFDNSIEMQFVYAYKAFIFEYYKQTMGLRIFRQCFKENPAAFRAKECVAIYRMLQLQAKEFESIKKHFDTEILAGTHNGIYTCAVEIPEQIKFADYAYIAPSYDLYGHRIKHTKRGMMHRIALTIFPEQNKSWLIMSCLESEKKIFDPLFRQAKEASLKKLKFYLNMMLPLFSENMVLSPDLWKPWTDEVKDAYTYYANLSGPDAKKMEICLGFALKNAHRDKTGAAYDAIPKINLFP